MIVVYILGGLLFLLLLLALLPVRVQVEFRGGFALELRYLFLRIPILPGEEGPEEEPEPEPEAPEEPRKKEGGGFPARVKAALKREGLAGFLQGLGELARLLEEAVEGVLRGLRLRRFDLYLCLGGAGGAAAAAVRYGQVAAGLYAVCGGLFSLMPCRRKGVTVDLDYGAPADVVAFSAQISIRPAVVAREAVVLFFRGLRPLRKMI